MAIAYRQILRMAARRVNAVTGVSRAALETAYMTAPLTAVQIGNVDFTRSMIVDNMISVVGSIVKTYANVHHHPFREYNLSQTLELGNRDALPSTDENGKSIVGVWGTFRDAITDEILTKQPYRLIESLRAGAADGSMKGQYYYYDIVGDRIVHSRATVVADVCVFDVADELAAVAADGSAPLPDALLDLAWTGLVASLMVDDEFVQQAQIHKSFFDQGLAQLSDGMTTIAPAPQLTASAAPVVS